MKMMIHNVTPDHPNMIAVVIHLPKCSVCHYYLEIPRDKQRILDVVLINSMRQKCDRWGDCEMCGKAQLIPMGAL